MFLKKVKNFNITQYQDTTKVVSIWFEDSKVD